MYVARQVNLDKLEMGYKMWLNESPFQEHPQPRDSEPVGQPPLRPHREDLRGRGQPARAPTRLELHLGGKIKILYHYIIYFYIIIL